MLEQLVPKLRYKTGRAAVLHAPEGYRLGIEEEGAPNGTYEFVMIFVNNAKEAEECLTSTIPLLKEEALFWIAFPKTGSKVKSDINRDILAAIVQNNTSYRPVSNIAIDDKWSALRFRHKDLVKSAKK